MGASSTINIRKEMERRINKKKTNEMEKLYINNNLSLEKPFIWESGFQGGDFPSGIRRLTQCVKRCETDIWRYGDGVKHCES